MSEIAIFKNSSELSPFKKSVRDGVIKAIINGLPIGLKERGKRENIGDSISFLLNEKSSGAPFWFFDDKNKQHSIVINNYLNFNKLTESNQTEGSKTLLRSILHEYGHALFTDIDIKKMKKILQSNGDVPFSMLNIFEDMRIEFLLSQNYLLGETLTDFTKDSFIEKNIISIEKTDTMLQVLIKVLGLEGKEKSTDYANPYYSIVKDYRQKAIMAKNTEEVAYISCEFFNKYRDLLKNKEEMGEAPQDEEEKEKQDGSSQGSSSKKGNNEDNDFDSLMDEIEDEAEGEEIDEENNEQSKETNKENNKQKKEIEKHIKKVFEEGLEDMQELSDKEIRELRKDCEVLNLAETEGKTSEITINNKIEGKTPYFHKENSKCSIKEESKVNNLIDLYTQKIPELNGSYTSTIKKITDIFLDILKPEKIKKSDYNDGDINVDNVIQLTTGTDVEQPLYNKEKWVIQKPASFHIVYDASGSMCGKPDINGKMILFAINEMARIGLIEAKLTVSKVSFGRSLYQTVELPICYKSIFTIVADGTAEGLANATLNSIKNKALEKDIILFFTDGLIGESDERSLITLFETNRKLTKKSIGIYLNELRNVDKVFIKSIMNKLFPKNIIESDVVECAKKIADLAAKRNINMLNKEEEEIVSKNLPKK